MDPAVKPIQVGGSHPLPLEKLSPGEFERLCFWLVEREGFERAEHLGEAGAAAGWDLVAWRGRRRFVFLCKRVQAFTKGIASREIDKLRVLPPGEQPHEIVFVVSRAVSAHTREAIRADWGDKATCHFWAGSELDERVKRHPELVREFFQLPSEPRRALFPLVNNLPYTSLGALFQGREEALYLLRERLTSAPDGRATAIAGKAIHGLGGIGKTRLAVEYAWRYANEYAALLFVGAISSAELQRNLAALCAREVLNLLEQEAIEEEVRAAAVVRWLGENSRWLLILDNVDSEEAATAADALVARLHGGHVLITGRLARWGAEVEPIELDLLTEKAAVAFLLSRTERKRRPTGEDEAHASEIARELGYLPLALEQAGAFVAERRLSLQEYLKEWQSRRDAVLTWFDPRISHYPASVAVSWQTSVDRLSPAARFFLDRLAWLGPEPIPETLLDVALPNQAGPRVNLREALAELAAYSLLTRGVEAPILTVHRLVQDVTRSGQRGDPEHRALKDALQWVDAAFVGDPKDVRSWPTLEPLLPHAKAVGSFADELGLPEPTGHLLSQLGLFLSAKARLSEAEAPLRRALAIEEESFGENDPRVAVRLMNLARVLQESDRLSEAEIHLERALAIFEGAPDDLLKHQGEALLELGQLLFRTSRLAEAEPLMRRAAAISEEEYGPNHPNVALALANLAQLIHSTNRWDEAEALLRRALKIREDNFGPEHPEVASTLNSLASLLFDTNRVSEAEPLMRRVLRTAEDKLGLGNPNVAAALSNLAQLLKITNRLGEAEPLLRRALEIAESNYGPEHPLVASALNNLSTLLLDLGKPKEAEALIKRALNIWEKSLGESHPNVASALNNLAQVLRRSKSIAEAEVLMRRALSINEQVFGLDSPNVAISLGNLATLLEETNRLAEAKPLLVRALTIDEQTFGPNHPAVAVDLNNLGAFLQATGDLNDAEPVMHRSLRIFVEFLRATGHEHPQQRVAIENYRGLLRVMGRSESEVDLELSRLFGEMTSTPSILEFETLRTLLNPIEMAYRLVLTRRARVESLEHLSASELRAAAEELSSANGGIERILEAQRRLKSETDGATPPALWLAWFETFNALRLGQVKEELLAEVSKNEVLH